jgi:putative ABC transport system permease protein
MKDVRVAIRVLARQPRLTFAIVATLGLAMGMNVAVFSAVHAVMFRALPFSSPGRIVWITSVRPDNPAAPFSLPEFIDYRAGTRTLSGLAAYANWSASIEGQAVTERLQGARMSANSFEVLGVAASAGRLLRESDDRPDAPVVAVLSYGLWQRQFGGAMDVVGRPLRINGESVMVVGILPQHFPLPLQGIDVIVPLAPERDPLRYLRDSVNFLRFFGRLRDGASRAQAETELTSICRSLRQQFPKEYARKDSVRAIPFQEALVGDHRQSMLLLLGAVVAVLATALANLVSLVLVRANDRRGEMAVRMALGASRSTLMRHMAIEASLLALAGSASGWLLAAWAVRLMTPWLPASIPRLEEIRIDQTVLLFALALTGLSTVLLSLAPLGVISRSRAPDGLQLETRGAVGDRRNHLVRQALVVAEIATALVLLVSTAVLVENVMQLQRVRPGFDSAGVFQVRVSIPPTYRTPDAVARFYDRLSERLAALPGVQHVGVISSAPLSGVLRTVPFRVLEAPPKDDRDVPSANFRVITPDYLSAVRSQLIDGRQLSETDRADSPPVALVSAALAARFLSPNPVGHHLLISDNSGGPRQVEVVGVVEDVRQTALDTPPAFDVYIPLRQIHPEGLGFIRDNQFWMIRVASNPDALRTPFLSELNAVDRDAASSDAGSFRALVEAWFGPRRFNLALFGVFSLTAVLIAVSGIYALISYTVSQRRREIGLRIAMGATKGHVQRLILSQAFRLLCAGLGVGLLIAVGARPDPSLAAMSAVLLTAVVILAAWLPARRASRVDPNVALRGALK